MGETKVSHFFCFCVCGLFIRKIGNMKHILVYDTASDFSTAEGNANKVTSIVPGVAYIKQDESSHYNGERANITVNLKNLYSSSIAGSIVINDFDWDTENDWYDGNLLYDTYQNSDNAGYNMHLISGASYVGSIDQYEICSGCYYGADCYIRPSSKPNQYLPIVHFNKSAKDQEITIYLGGINETDICREQ